MFQELLSFRGNEDEDEGDEQPPITPCHPRINGAPLCLPSAQSHNPVTPACRLGQTPGHSHTSQCRTQYQDGPAGSKKHHTADDMWKFFPLKNDQHIRMFIMQVRNYLHHYHNISWMCYRPAGDQVKMFSKGTGQATFMIILWTCTENEWIKLSLKQGITIKGKDGWLQRPHMRWSNSVVTRSTLQSHHLLIDPNLLMRCLWIVLLNGLLPTTR